MTHKKLKIYHRKDGRVEGRFIKSYDPAGKALYGAVYGKDEDEVKFKYNILLSEGLHIEPKDESGTTVYGSILRNLERKKTLIKPSTACIYERYLENHIKPFFVEMELYKFNAEELQKFINAKLDEGLSVRTVQSIFIFIKSSMKEAVAEQLITDFFNRIYFPKIRNTDMRVFTEMEQKRIESVIENCKNSHEIGILICLYTGIRIGELCGLMWDDIDLESRMLHIRRTMQRIKTGAGSKSKTKIVYLAPKTETSYRSIPLPQFLTEILNKYKENRSGEFVMMDGKKIIEPRNIQYNFKKILEKAGVTDANYHTLRHTFATRALENGFDAKTLSEILGHSSPTITLTKYAHSLYEHKKRKMELLGSLYQPSNVVNIMVKTMVSQV